MKVRYKECLEAHKTGLAEAPWSKIPVEFAKGRLKLPSLAREIPINRHFEIVTKSHLDRTLYISYPQGVSKHIGVIWVSTNSEFTGLAKFLYTTKQSPPFCEFCSHEFQDPTERYRCGLCKNAVCADCFFPQGGGNISLCKPCLEDQQNQQQPSAEDQEDHTPQFRTRGPHSVFTFGQDPSAF